MRAALAVAVFSCSDPGRAWDGGIGAVLRFRERDRSLVVQDVPPDTAAARAGLAVGDEVVEIDGAPVADMTLEEVVRRLRGPVASRVRLAVRRAAVTREVEVEREPYR